MRAKHARAIWIVGGTALVSAGAAILVRFALPKKLASKVGGRVYADTLVAVALESLPDSTTVLGEPSPEWDALLGGKKNASQWAYYDRGFGTTCGVVAAAWAEKAGWPADLINRDPPGGSGFKIGAHISRLHDGARAHGWLREPKHGELPDLQPGDILGTVHPSVDKDGNPLAGEHVDVVLSVEPQDDGSLHIETADGGQEDAHGNQAAKRRQRSVRVDGSVVTPGSGNAHVAWWIHPET